MSLLSNAWRVVDSVHPVTRAALQVIIDDYESKLSSLRELHKSIGDECSHCSSLIRYGSDGAGKQFFPCPTIKVLERENNGV